MIGVVGLALPQFRDDAARRRDDILAEARLVERAGPAVEQLHRIGPGLDLRRQMLDRGVRDLVDEIAEPVGIGKGPALRMREIAARAAFDHVGRDRPRASGKADERDLARQRRLDAAHGVVDRGEPLRRAEALEPFGGSARAHRLEHRALAVAKRDRLAERMRHHQYVREQDRRIHAEAADRLQRRLGGELGREAEIEEGWGAFPELAIFRQVAPGLAHQPERRHRQSFAGKRPQERFRRVAPDRLPPLFHLLLLPLLIKNLKEW